MSERLTLNEAMLIQRQWEEPIIGETKPIDRLNRFVDEMMEVVELLEDKKAGEVERLIDENEAYRRALCMEIIDAFIIGLSFIDKCGYDPENLFLQKLTLNYQKYKLQRIQELLGQGLSRDQSLQIIKSEWDNMYPRNDFGNHQYESNSQTF